MPNSPRWLMVLALAFVATAARAEFHTFQIEELYSNADGSVQYIVLHESQGMDGENLLRQRIRSPACSRAVHRLLHVLAQPAGRQLRLYMAVDPAPTAGKRVLIATAGFAALNLVTPDYVIPNGFLPISGGTLNYALVDQVSWSALPTDGGSALNRADMTIPNMATNFAGQSASIAAAAAVNYQGLWFNPAESGWGINFAHQGDLIFASWFTYDLTGKGTWLVMTASKTAAQHLHRHVVPGHRAGVRRGTVSAAGQSWGRHGVRPDRHRDDHLFRREQRVVRLHGQRNCAEQGDHPAIAGAGNGAGVHVRRATQPGARDQLHRLVVGRARRLGGGLGHQSHAPGRSDLRHLVHLCSRPLRRCGWSAPQARRRRASIR